MGDEFHEDPVLQEVSASRRQIWLECCQDRSKLRARRKAISAERPDRVVTRADLERMRHEPAPELPASALALAWEDPIVKEVHQAREQIWRDCHGDRQEYIALWKATDAEHSQLPPKSVKIRARTSAGTDPRSKKITAAKSTSSTKKKNTHNANS